MISTANQSRARQPSLKPTHVNFGSGSFEVTKWNENNVPIQIRTPADELIDIKVFPRQINEKR